MHGVWGALHSIIVYRALPYSTHCRFLCLLVTMSDCVIFFQVKQNKFREMFRATAPYNYSSVHPYISLDTVGFHPLCNSRTGISTLNDTKWRALGMQCLPGWKSDPRHGEGAHRAAGVHQAVWRNRPRLQRYQTLQERHRGPQGIVGYCCSHAGKRAWCLKKTNQKTRWECHISGQRLKRFRSSPPSTAVQ